MSLLAQILEEESAKKIVCKIGKMLDQQTDEVYKEIQEVLESEIPSNKIAAALEKYRGIVISDSSLRKHRRGDCNCKVTP